MQDRCFKPQNSCGTNLRESVCIHTDKVFDSCRDKDCIEDARVYFTESGQEIIDKATKVKCAKAEVIWVFSDIESVPFNRGFYSVDLKYFFKITINACTGAEKPVCVEGLLTFNKRVILFGSEGNAKTFSSKYKPHNFDTQMWKKMNMPYAVVEVIDPIILGTKLMDAHYCKKSCCADSECDLASVPRNICGVFDGPLAVGGECKRVFVSLGVFSIVKLERKVQLLVPSFDYCIPNKECVCAKDDKPCDLFERIEFPLEEFYPPKKSAFLPSRETDSWQKNKKCGCR